MVEIASYENLKKINGIEIRKYPKMLLAIVEGYKDDSGFNLLFNYISGDNKIQKKIPMTAPVITSEKIPMTAPVISKDSFMAFVLPSFYNEQTVPIPLDHEVKIKVQPEKIYAVLRFSGRTFRNRIQKQIEKLYSILKSENIKIKDGPILMRYNSPFTPGFLRRNEVAVEIDNFK